MQLSPITRYPKMQRGLLGLIVIGWFMLQPLVADAADLLLRPATGVYSAGQTFTVNVQVNTRGKTISAVEGTLSFPTDELSVVRVAKGTLVDLWVSDPAYNNSNGTISFTGGMLPPGYRGSSGNIMSVTFRSKGSGPSRVSFTNGSVNEFSAAGSNVLTNMTGGTYTIAAVESSPTPEVIEYVPPANTPGRPVVSSPTHSDPAGWYQGTTAELNWTLPAGVTAVRTLLDSSPSSVPTKVYEPPIRTITVDDLELGEQYFHVQFQNQDGWGTVAHYRLAVDTDDPTFSISLPEVVDYANPEQTLMLHASDTTSYIARYEVQVDGGEPYEHLILDGASSTITLAALEPGKHTVVIEAFDAAGNSAVDTFSFTIESFGAPVFTDIPTQINTGVVPVFTGVTRPDATVTVRLEKAGTEPVTYSLTSDAEGQFTFIPETALSDGVYDISAQAVDTFGAQSDWSPSERFVVTPPGLVRIGSYAVSVLSVLVPLVGLTVLLLLGLLIAWRRFRSTMAAVTKETSEVVEVVEKQFAVIRKDVQSAADTLAKTRKSNSLTKAETALMASIERSLESGHKQIKAEVDDVTDIIDND